MKKNGKTISFALLINSVFFLIASISLFVEGDIEAGIFGIVFTICLAAPGYFIGKKAKAELLKQQQEEQERILKQQQEEQERIARQREFEAHHGKINTSVVGVTFDNEDGSSRQKILKAIYKAEIDVGLFYTDGTLVQFEYEGSPAVHVMVEDKCIGNIAKKDLGEVLPILPNIEKVTVYLDRFKNEEDKEWIYTADIDIVYKK